MALEIGYQTTNPIERDRLIVAAINAYSGSVYTINGAKGDGIADDTAYVLNTAAQITSAGKGILRIDGIYLVKSSIVLPADIDIYFTPGSKIKTSSDGNYTANAVFLINTSDGITWNTAYPNVRGSATNVFVDNSANPSKVVGAMICGAPIKIKNIRTSHCHFTVKTTGNYLDHFRIDGAMHNEPQGSAFPIQLSNLGDGLSIRSSHSFLSGGVPKNIKLTACGGGEIQGAIGGDIYVEACRAVKMHGCHMETGVTTADGSDLSIEDSLFWAGPSPRVVCLSVTGERRTVTLTNVLFQFNKTAVPASYSSYDVKTHPRISLVVNNCRKICSDNTNAYTSEQSGILIQDNTGADLTNWNNYSYILSRRGRISYTEDVELSFVISVGSGSIDYLASGTTNAATTWGIGSGTYYYSSQLIYDKVRKLGITVTGTTEKNIATTNGGNGVMFVCNLGNRLHNGFIRLYRGTATGSYSQYVDIPSMGIGFIFDDGTYVNGFPWVTRAAGAVDSLQDCSGLELVNGYARAYRSSAPTVGAWIAGDSTWNNSPTAGGFLGTTCVTAGSPGTHKTYGAISP